MENKVAVVVELPYCYTMKVHRLICLELKKCMDRVSQIFPSIESARPQCLTGLKVMCSLHVSMEKAKLLILHCSESSKLYLAVTGEKILLRSEKIRNTLELCLSQIQNMVPPWLEDKISRVLDDLRVATFTMESSEAEAGKVLLALVRLDIAASTSVNMSELKPLQMAALWLHITTPMAVLIERRSIKRLLEKVQGTDPNKEKILKYLLYLVRKYGRSIGGYQTEPVVLNVENSWEQAQIAVSGEHEPPEQFKCPLSTRLMYDPVIIANGQTFERVWIKKWFDEGHKTCPKTDTKLADLLVTPNDAIKDLISRWCTTHGVSVPKPCSQPTPPDHRLQKLQSSSSIASFGSSMNGLHLQISNVSIRSSNTNCGFDLSHEKIKEGIEINPSPINLDPFNLKLHTNGRGISLSFLSKLSTLPWPTQCKAVEDVKTGLEENSLGSHTMISNSYIKPLIRFLKDAYDRCDLKAQRDGAELILTFLREIGNEMPPLQEDAIYVLSSLLDSEITEEALAIMEIVSIQQCYKSTILAGVLPSILRILGNHIGEHHLLLLALKILNNFSANMDTAQHMVYLDFISKLAPFLGYRNLAGYCLKVLKNLCNIEEARVAVSESNVCVDSLIELLEIGTNKEQEFAMDIMISLCNDCAKHCQLVMKERTIRSLENISVHGNARGKVIATDLLQLLKDCTNGHHHQEDSIPTSDFKSDTSQESADSPKQKKKASKASRFLGKRIAMLSKRRH
ncbi:U-box domain-containing protein [Actinidia chinensis var. chinensis]|uniref:RING-type E3 ubiquitin transferase n=1 Tax=Actinidia chinensis var. chinensis TaxID=1590841 RepID=A0A2R6PZW5_ACTCC|nr:U-box domain-containing protein [Actinidia chinensis var. chinensis]